MSVDWAAVLRRHAQVLSAQGREGMAADLRQAAGELEAAREALRLIHDEVGSLRALLEARGEGVN